MQIGKTAQNAIAAMSYLAECYRDELGPVSSQSVADARGLSKPLAAKILTKLSQIDIVRGSTGPGGGYELAKDPANISLLEVVSCFELQNKVLTCPFGEDWCGNQAPCPLHDEIVTLMDDLERFLVENNFGGFASPSCSSKWVDQEDK
ncbi:MAG: Rrf2 family transcriptional regulator [Verrucomicrobiae bacterium]|nr:Rrf2 family transcriptional regulator [Verrucomicrobiae bacterium]NNJ41765.1 Rrf2 family transcriptional regulator [Akkermansiaceae bacterium]